MRHMVYKRFERFWHWTQSLLIIVMIATGFEIHGSYQWLGFEGAMFWHEVCALTLVVLWLFCYLLAFHHRRVASVHSNHREAFSRYWFLCSWDFPWTETPIQCDS